MRRNLQKMSDEVLSLLSHLLPVDIRKGELAVARVGDDVRLLSPPEGHDPGEEDVGYHTGRPYVCFSPIPEIYRSEE